MTLEEEFVSLIQGHKGLLNKLVFLYADYPEERNDLRQEILLQAWRSYPSYRREAKFSTWLYRLGLNVALTALTHRKRSRSLNLPDHQHVNEISYDTSDQLRHILQQFNTVDRTVLVMKMEGYKDEEISEALGISAANTRTKLHRIRQKVDKLWT